MSDPISNLPTWQLELLTAVTEALGDPAMSYPEQASLAIMIRSVDSVTLDNLTDLFRRVSQANRFLELPGTRGDDEQ